LIEAARLDGASNLTTLLRILLPIAKGGLVVAAVFAFLQGYNDFAIAFILGGAQTVTMPVALNILLSGRLVLWNTIFAIGVLNLIPAVVLVFLVRKNWARGLSLGLVK
jgi:ABC-type glycerol-3-phosphate transport system permease component